MQIRREHFEAEKIFQILYLGSVVFLTWRWIVALNARPAGSEAVLVLLFPLIYMYYLFFATWVCDFRNIELDEEGCRIRFFKYEKRYCWEELKEKQLAEVKWMYYKEAVILSRQKNRRPKWMDVLCYKYCRPFSYVIIFLEEEDTNKGYGGIYSVDKKEFMENMEKWNVTLEKVGYIPVRGGRAYVTYDK